MLQFSVVDPGHDLKLDRNINENHQKRDQLRNFYYYKIDTKFKYSLKIMS
jgi:hypothetical protein